MCLVCCIRLIILFRVEVLLVWVILMCSRLLRLIVLL